MEIESLWMENPLDIVSEFLGRGKFIWADVNIFRV
jgi:hypothetical protein